MSKQASDPLQKRAGFRETMRDPLRAELGQLAERHGVTGCVLITFRGDRIGTFCSAKTDEFLCEMQKLADAVLAKIDDGEFHP